MPQPVPKSVRFDFATQRPREDGCGGYVLQMLTGVPYGEVARQLGWADDSVHHSSWVEMRTVLSQLNWAFDEPVPAQSWDEVHGLAIVHVRDDHFMLYDGENGLFYDPAEASGPQHSSARIPIAFMTVGPPQSS